MKLYGVLVLFVTFSVASGLKCYSCVTTDPSTCTNTETCPGGFNQCASVKIDAVTTKSCMLSAGCIGPVKCCEKDLCNGAVPTGPGVTLLLLSSALMMLFI